MQFWVIILKVVISNGVHEMSSYFQGIQMITKKNKWALFPTINSSNDSYVFFDAFRGDCSFWTLLYLQILLSQRRINAQILGQELVNCKFKLPDTVTPVNTWHLVRRPREQKFLLWNKLTNRLQSNTCI